MSALAHAHSTLRGPKNASGLRRSSRFSTAAEIAALLFLPLAAQSRNSPGAFDFDSNPREEKRQPPKGDCLFFWCSSGDSHASLFPLRETVKRDKGIRQCPHWLMHTPPACAILIRIPLKQKNRQAKACLFFWCSSGDSNPGHPA